jgi:hypothetical protein
MYKDLHADGDRTLYCNLECSKAESRKMVHYEYMFEVHGYDI